MNYISHLKPHIFTRLIQTKLTMQTNQVLLLKPNSSPISFLYIRTEIYNLSDNVHHGPPAVPDHSPDRPDTESQPRPVQLPVIERAINRACGSSRLSIATSLQPAPASEVRRSARASKALNRRWSRAMGNITTQQISLLSDFHRSLSGGGGGITGTTSHQSGDLGSDEISNYKIKI